MHIDRVHRCVLWKHVLLAGWRHIVCTSSEVTHKLLSWSQSLSFSRVMFTSIPFPGQCGCGHPQLSEWEKVSCVALSGLPWDQWTESWCSLGRGYKQFLQVCFQLAPFHACVPRAPRNSLPGVWAQHLAWDNKTQGHLLLLWGPVFYQKQVLVGIRSAEQFHCIFQVDWIPWWLDTWRNHSVSSKKNIIQHILDAYSGSGTV